MVCPVSVQERLRGRRRGSLPFVRRPRADSRGQLTRGLMEHSSGRGDVLSPRAPTTLGMALQCLGWCRGGRDGRTGLMVTEGTRPTSRHGPMRARTRRGPMARSEEQVRGRRGRGGLERGGPHPRGRPAPERGGTSPEGGTDPRARRASPEGASSPRARRTSPEGVFNPRARRNLTRGGDWPSSEAEFC
jgi:hypothetical protein